jgi:hypothetical protein
MSRTATAKKLNAFKALVIKLAFAVVAFGILVLVLPSVAEFIIAITFAVIVVIVALKLFKR